MKDNVVKLELPDAPPSKLVPVPGGKDPTHNWLADLTEQTSFVSKRRMPTGQDQMFLDEWTLTNNRMKTFVLCSNLAPGEPVFVRVDPKTFSRHNELIEVIEEGQE